MPTFYLNYRIQYVDIDGNDFRLDISGTTAINPGRFDFIEGYCQIEYLEVDSLDEPIRASGLTIFLDASIERDFIDLWSDSERNHKVVLNKNSEVIFIGFINPEGIFQDWVNQRWTLRVDCSDGLGFLKNLAYVQDSGLPFTGKQTVTEIIHNCLHRTGIDIDLNIRVDYYPTQFSPTDGFGQQKNVADSILINTDRFYRDDGETVMDCYEVLSTTIRLFNACVCQMKGEWYVFCPVSVSRVLDGQIFFRYSRLTNTPMIPFSKSISTRVVIGNDIDKASLFHCNKNQRIEIQGSLGAFKINYKYGLASSLFDNEYMDWNVGNTIDEWSILNGSVVSNSQYPPTGVFYTRLQSYTGQDYSHVGETPLAAILSDSIPVVEGTALTLEIDAILAKYVDALVIKILLDVGTEVLFLHAENGWLSQTGDTRLYLKGVRSNDDADNSFVINMPFAPTTGDLTITIYQPRDYINSINYAYIKRLRIYPSKDNTIQGENHIVYNQESRSVDDTLELFNGDNPSNIYEGTIYHDDGVTPTDTWKRSYMTETLPLLRILAEEKIRMRARPVKIFTGDVKGNFDFISKITINDVEGVFMPLHYLYDTKNNITSLINKQIMLDELQGSEYEFSIDYGETVKPTIK